MKSTKKILKYLIPAITLGLVTTAAASLGSSPASAFVDTPWGPDRTTFTWADPAPYATFNSITDNPQLGDERNFVRIRQVDTDNYFGDEVTVTPGKTYEVYIYYHNNADAHEVGKTAVGIADGAAVKSTFPATIKAGERAIANATVFANDTNPTSVWDGAYLTATQDVYMRYVPGTAIIHNGGALNGQSIGPDYLFGDGALLGYDTFSGLLPGCNQYAGYITYQIVADAPNFEVTKSIVGDSTNFHHGDEVTFKIRYENTGTMTQENVVVLDTLPQGLTYVPGSTKLYNNNNPDGKSVNDDIVAEHGMNIGDYAGGSGWAEVTYVAKIDDDAPCGLTNSALVSTTDGNKSASVTLSVDGCDVTCETNPEMEGCQQPSTTEETCATNPNLPGCQEMPNTGPVEIAIAALVVVGICGGGYYLYRTHRTLRTVEHGVMTGTGHSGKTSKFSRLFKKRKSSKHHKDPKDTDGYETL